MEQRFLRSKAERNALFLAAGGKCQMCARELPENWHADHIEPFCETGRTNVHEMQALCPSCNLKKGTSMAFTFGSDFSYSLDPYPGVRRGILEALVQYRSWLYSRDPNDLDWSLIAPCRYGKSDFIRTAALIGLAEKKTGPALIVHPFKLLAAQIVEPRRLDEWERRWKAFCRRHHKLLRDFGARPFQNKEWLGSVHIQAIVGAGTDGRVTNLKILAAFCKSLIQEYGLPPVMFPDEAHRYGIKNHWGDIPRCWMDSGGIIVPTTATGFRHDGDDLISETTFRKKETKREDYRYYTTRPHEDPSLIWVATHIGEKTDFEVTADFEIPSSRAWEEGAASKSSVDWIDVTLRELTECKAVDKEDLNKKLSELPPWKASRCLSVVCRDPKVIAEFAQRIVKQLQIFRSEPNTRDATAVIYGLNDKEGYTDNWHLVEIKRAIALIAPYLVSEIATLKTDAACGSEDDKSIKIITRFTDKDAKTIDILLLKQMGTMGIDSDRICVVGTLDTNRSASDKIQQWGRGGNVWGSCHHYVIVALQDTANVTIYKNYISDEGGSITEKEIYEMWEEAKKKEEPPPPPLFAVEDPIQSGASDCEGDTCTPLGYSIALHVLEIFPSLCHQFTIPQLAERGSQLGVGPLPDLDAPPPFNGDSASEADSLTNTLYELTKAGARHLFRREHGRFPNLGEKAERDEYGGTFKPMFIRMVKEAADIKGTWDKNDKNRISEVAVLRRAVNVAEQIIGRLADENA